MVGDPPIIRGPDGFQHYTVTLPRDQDADVAVRPFRDVVGLCTDEGLGCVLAAEDGTQFVFWYGDLLAMRLGGTAVLGDGGSAVGPPGQMLVAAPSEELLPSYARRVLRAHLEAAGVTRHGVLLIDQAGHDPSRSVVFDVYPEDLADPATYQQFMGNLTWFRRYGVGAGGRGG